MNTPEATSAGIFGSEYESIKQFRHFARVQLGKKWYLISKFKESRVHLRLKQASESQDQMDHNNDNDMADEVWIKPGLVEVDQTNNNWNP